MAANNTQEGQPIYKYGNIIYGKASIDSTQLIRAIII